MYRVLIADDEHLVCALLQKLIHWDELGLTLLDTVSDGLRAWELIQSERPEIVITDIRMPGMDGLELADRANEADIPCSFVLISGHTEFSYALHAIKYGVVDYLIKPINENELNAVLGKICEKCGAKEQTAQNEDLLRRSLSKIRAGYLREVVRGERVPESLAELNENAQTAFQEGPLRVIALCLDAPAAQKGEEQAGALLFAKAQELTERAFDALGGQIVCLRDGRLLIGLVGYPEETEETFATAGRTLLDELFTRVNLYERCAVTLAVSERVAEPRRLGEAARHAADAVCARLSLGTNQLIWYEKLPVYETHTALTDMALDELRNSVEACDAQRLNFIINRLLSAIIHAPIADCDRIREVERLMTRFFDMMEEEDGVDGDAETARAAIGRIGAMAEFGEMCRAASDCAERAYARYLARIRQRTVRPVYQAQQYIDSHLDGELTLEQVAAQVYLNPVYFSMIFKEETGINFSKYVAAARVQKAKEYLRDPELSIAQAAARVGYKNQKHFSRLFKKITGINPSDYRRLHL